MTHAAINLSTYEVLTSSTVNGLKRHIARHERADRRWAVAEGIQLPKSRWIFAHGANWGEKLAAKRS